MLALNNISFRITVQNIGKHVNNYATTYTQLTMTQTDPRYTINSYVLSMYLCISLTLHCVR